jgi:hypothetical protein
MNHMIYEEEQKCVSERVKANRETEWRPEKQREAATAHCGRPERERAACEGPDGGGALLTAVVQRW